MKRPCPVRQPIAIRGASFSSSCTWVPSYVSNPGITIERVATPTGRVNCANFWAGTQGIQLQGEATLQPVTNGPLGGHVNKVVTSPDGGSTGCWTTHQQVRPRYVQKIVCHAVQGITDRRQYGTSQASRGSES